jgi:hypothetical protein
MKALATVLRKVTQTIWGGIKHEEDYDGKMFSRSRLEMLERNENI